MGGLIIDACRTMVVCVSYRGSRGMPPKDLLDYLTTKLWDPPSKGVGFNSRLPDAIWD